MSGLEVLSPQPEVIELSGGDRFLVYPVTIGQLIPFIDKFSAYLPAALAALEGDAFPCIQLVINDVDGLIGAVSFCTGISSDRVAQLAPEQFIKVYLAIVQANKDLFIQDKQKNHIAYDKNVWANSIARLIKSGHSLEQIKNYTLAQFKWFLSAIDRADKVSFKQMILAARIAQYDKDGFKRALEEIDNGE